MHFDVLTLFPEMFAGPLDNSIIGKARQKNLVTIKLWNIRDFAEDKHKIVDDTPYGGGAGMVFKVDVLARAIESVSTGESPLIYLSPQGQPFSQAIANRLAQLERVCLLCGHYEDIDERIRLKYVDEEISIGDYVLTGGELPAMVVIDAVSRLLPGVLGTDESAYYDSFTDGLLDYPHYTRPIEFNGMAVPEILTSGHHEKIRVWRLKEAIRNTLRKRPDLIGKRSWNPEEERLLDEVMKEEGFERR